VEFEEYCQNFITTFLSKIEGNAKDFSDVAVRRKLMSFKNLVDSKIFLGKIRSLLMKVVQEGKFSYKDYAELSVEKGFFDTSLENFLRYASTEASNEVL